MIKTKKMTNKLILKMIRMINKYKNNCLEYNKNNSYKNNKN